MIWFLAVVAVLVLGAIAVVAAGAGGSMHQVHPDRPDSMLPADRELTADDLRTVRLAVGVRGYRMDEVDTLLERLADELEARDRRPDAPTSGAREENRDDD